MRDENIRCMIDRAINYLVSIQDMDGSWRDYRLPIGESDQWVTAFTGLGLLKAAIAFRHTGGISAAKRAAKFLQDNKVYEAGWGYNSYVGVDADSTAHAVRLFRELDIALEHEDENMLMEHYDGKGGFKTYCKNSEWGSAHPDVTAAVGLALNNGTLQEISSDLIYYCESIRLEDGTWPTYWWRNKQYGTFYMLELFERLNQRVYLEQKKVNIRIDSCFDLAWTIGILILIGVKGQTLENLIRILMDRQEEFGAWPGSPSLRVTDPKCSKPWIAEEGLYYTDIRATITTSSVLRVLAMLC